MPYNGPGLRHRAVASKACEHGQIVVENGFVGAAVKQKQLGAFVNPEGTGVNSPRHIPIGEELEIEYDGIVEAPLAGGIAAAVVGTPIFITDATNALGTVGGAGTSKVGRVTAIDATRSPSVARINTNAKASF